MLAKDQKFRVGDHVVYHKSKMSTQPGPRAADVRPLRHGDGYSYFVDKYWTVSSVIDDHTIEVKTRTGKRHKLDIADPSLQKAGTVQNLLFKNRFPEVVAS